MLELTRQFGIGAQFGGKYFCHDVRVIRLPRHGASLPVGVAVSCSADRQAKAKITPDGVFLEQLETDPARFLPETDGRGAAGRRRAVDLNRPMDEIRAQLSTLPVKTRVSLTGPLVVARDIAHAKIAERLEAGEPMPAYLRDHPVYYAGPAKTPEGYASGSFGPTTAGRMDSYVEQFQAAGGSLVMLAKGNRSAQVTTACATYGGFYLGSIGGPAARLAQDCIRQGRRAGVPGAGHGGGLEDRGRGLPRVRGGGRQGQRLLRGDVARRRCRCRSGDRRGHPGVRADRDLAARHCNRRGPASSRVGGGPITTRHPDTATPSGPASTGSSTSDRTSGRSSASRFSRSARSSSASSRAGGSPR